MSVEVLSLSGLSAAEAVSAAMALLDIDSGGPDRVDRLLVLDDTPMLAEHLESYQRIDTSHRVGKLMCVAVGPRPAGERKLLLPGTTASGGPGAGKAAPKSRATRASNSDIDCSASSCRP